MSRGIRIFRLACLVLLLAESRAAVRSATKRKGRESPELTESSFEIDLCSDVIAKRAVSKIHFSSCGNLTRKITCRRHTELLSKHCYECAR
jgi:hypothetical protein